jgi:hypothetical protein
VSAVLSAHVERTIELNESGDADDVLSITWKNSGDSPAQLSVGLEFAYREVKTTFLRARDRQGAWEPVWRDDLDTAKECLSLTLDGTVEPQQKRVVAVQTRRERLATVLDDGLLLRDPLYAYPLPELGNPSTSYEAVVIFPDTTIRRTVKATRAINTTGRVASFRFGTIEPKRLEYLTIEAEWRRIALPLSPRDVDDAIACLHRAIALGALGDQVNLDVVQLPCRRLGVNLPSHSEFEGMPFWARDGALRQTLANLTAARAVNMAQTDPPPGTQLDVLRLAEHVGRNVERLLGDLSLVPLEAGEALVEVLQYQRTQRDRPSKWVQPLKEAQFQERLHEFIAGRGLTAVREPLVAGGRADLLLGATSVELKVIDMESNPARHVVTHLNQAAEYVAAKGSRFGLLVILDSHMYSKGGAHLPHARDQVRVDLVKSESGVGGVSQTAIVTVVVPAFPPRPSEMGGA